MVSACVLIDGNKKKEYRITGEMHDYIYSIIHDAISNKSKGIFETEVGEH